MMQTIPALTPEEAPAASRPLLAAVEAKLGRVPAMMRSMAHSPALLGGYLALSGALAEARLDVATRERIALALAEANRCGYCLSAHAVLGRMAGLAPDEIAAARTGRSAEAKAHEALRLALAIGETTGDVGAAALDAARAAGLDDAEIVEIVGVVALNLLTNMFNRLAATEIDFPKVALAPAA
jgi:uncharacterized peroxidase-related enzyme